MTKHASSSSYTMFFSLLGGAVIGAIGLVSSTPSAGLEDRSNPRTVAFQFSGKIETADAAENGPIEVMYI